MGFAEYCKDCPFILRSIQACPRPQVFAEGDAIVIFLELLWVISSAAALVLFLAIAFNSIAKKTSRGFSIFSLLFGQHLVCEAMRRFYPEERPEGACTDSSAFPSTHTAFSGCLATWLFLEMMFMNGKAPFKNGKNYKMWRNLFFVYNAIIPLARYNLNYHTLDQLFFGYITGALSAIGYFAFLLITVVYQDIRGYRRSMLARLWKKLQLKDNYTYYRQEEDKMAIKELKELQKKAESVSKLKNDLKAQRDELAKRVNLLQTKNSKKL